MNIDRNWSINSNRKIKALFLVNQYRNPVTVGRIENYQIILDYKILKDYPDRVAKLIKAIHENRGDNSQAFNVISKFSIKNIDGLRKTYGGKSQNVWRYSYKPDANKVTSQGAVQELNHAKHIKKKLSKYLVQLKSDISSMEKLHKGLKKLRNSL